tara:strand:+ start:1151 stop:2194 length:1044 start_codon:yes stop_codon:yes gene_type:complete
MKNSRNILITGAAGFIGAALSIKLLKRGENVIGIDNLNKYYDPNLKKLRLFEINKVAKEFSGKWNFHQLSIENHIKLQEVADCYSPEIVVNLAAQAGVRYSIENPKEYLNSNLVGFGNILELCRNNNVKNFIYASSSSVYGGNKEVPFKESHSVDHPISLYAASKKANEVMAHSYSHLYQIPSTGLRFFTVYGPYGRPDMAPMIFANLILRSKPINVFNYGNMFRDFTYIDDIVGAIEECCYKPAQKDIDFDFLNPDISSSFAPHLIFNVGSNNPISLIDFISKLEEKLDVKASKNLLPIQPGDVERTWADITKLNAWIGYKPLINFDQGIERFAIWYEKYFQNSQK